MTSRRWEFWIDVGGTFTDCIARRSDGTLARHKLLSSGVTKGTAASGSRGNSIVDLQRASDPEDFWVGFTCRLLDESGNALSNAMVTGFDRATGTLLLSENLDIAPRQAYELLGHDEAPVIGIRYLLGLRQIERIPPVSVRLGTTRGTNALITRRGAPTAFVTTRGFGDVLLIGYQNRPRLFELAIRKPEPLFAAVVEINERLDANGKVLIVPDGDAVRGQLAELKSQGIESLAVCLLHAIENPAHEKLVEGIAREIGFTEISISSQVAPLAKIVSRGDTTVVDAYLNPVLRDYVAKLREALPDSDLRILTSAGGLVEAARFVGKDSILSGPAGGVVGFSRVAQASGFQRAIGFDMGGTSTDVSRFDGRFELEFETEKSGVRVVAPMMAIETVAAGGGSICHFDGVRLRVGPASAGADPGPACYGRGGPLAVTDLNLYLGKILAERFPFPLEREAVEVRLKALCSEIKQRTGTDYSVQDLAEGFLRVANTNMSKAIRSISIAKGYDPREYALVAFGGAAGQHICAIARELEMKQVLVHPDAGLLSALGIGLADHTRHRVAGIYQPYSDEAVKGIAPQFDKLAADATAELEEDGIPNNRVEIRRSLDLRYRGVDAYLNIAEPDQGSYADSFVREHERLYGYVHQGRPLEIVAARVECVGRSGESLPASQRMAQSAPQSDSTINAYFGGQYHQTRVFNRRSLRPGDSIDGPAIVCDAASTTVINPGWRGETLSGSELLLTDTDKETKQDSAPIAAAVAIPVDPVLLEIFNNQFAGIAEQMGITLRNTAGSVNVKERLDFSCALFTSAGDLVVNAPHIPVHLGAMGETVKRILADNPDLQPGDVYVTNDPYRGGSHLPDITVITPVHEAVSGRLLFFTACRAHHAEIGGMVPGSMPPASRNLAEEGVLIRNFKLIDAGRPRFDALRELWLAGPYPTRAVADNLADITAQVAANRQGARHLQDLIDRQGLAMVETYMRHIQTAAEQKMRAALGKLPPGTYEFVDHLDDGSPIAVAITIDGNSATVDFTGTGAVLPNNLNANRAIVTAAVMYTLRCLIDEDIPLNQGVLAPVRLVLPECLLNPPQRENPGECAAVAGGNVETSQRIVDVLFGALSLAAASQGTMNNLLFGDSTFAYYETICGGAGATAKADGADAVHTHMTNTRLTDPEIIERRFPVRVREFSIHRGSGGNGRHRGGDGVVRRLEFLRALDVSILSQRRGRYAPYGMAGGMPGTIGCNTLLREDGSEVLLGNQVQISVRAGEVLTIETPGGGGYGDVQ